jgi:hypothetical protein
LEEILRTAKAAVGLLLVIILSRVLYDVLTSEHGDDYSHWGLVGLMLTLISVVIAMLTESYALNLPLWAHVWHIINLVSGVVSIYSVVLAVRKE